MPREKEGFRDQLVRLDELFPGRETLKLDEVAKLVGLDRRTLLKDKAFPAKKLGENLRELGGVYIVPKVALARWLA